MEETSIPHHWWCRCPGVSHLCLCGHKHHYCTASGSLQQSAELIAGTDLHPPAPGVGTVPTAKPETASLHSGVWEDAGVVDSHLYPKTFSYPRSQV